MSFSSSSSHVSKLFSSFKLHDLVLNNRIVMSPMTRARCGSSGVPGDMVVEYYQQRASAGLIVSEGITISPQGRGWNGAPGIYTDAQEAGWQRVVEAVHAKGGKIFAQLWHTGRASHSAFHDGALPVSASAVKLNGEYIHTPQGKLPYDDHPRPLETEEVAGVVEDYRRAGERAKNAGFDGVELHAANGYLIDQFLQSKTNHRSDRYGGSVENRSRFLEEIVQALTLVYPSHRIAVRLSPNGVYNDMGSPDFREQFTHAIKSLNKYNLAYLDLCDGLGFGFHKLGEPFTIAEARALWSGALSANVGYTKETALQLAESGTADLVTIGRPFISNPDLVERWKNNWPENEAAPFTVWYSEGPEGYVDYLPFQQSQ